jgi:RimJ/RimL family protein N-acetyltransferase
MYEPLPSEVLEKARTLPVKPDSAILSGTKVKLVPTVVDTDAQALYEISNGTPVTIGRYQTDAYDPDERVWRYLFHGPFDSVDAFADDLNNWVQSENGLCFTVFDAESGRAVGVTNYMRNHPEHLRIELGGIWYTPAVQRTGVNTEAAYLMLKHAFDLGYRRVEWKCHADHIRSRNAALRLGFTFEGIQEAHMIWKGRSRDTAWFRMLSDEWPDVRAALEERLVSQD